MSREKVLVVEDEKNLTKILRYNLEKAGYHVLVAGDGETGLVTFRKERPSLVLLDAMMPKLDGFEFLKIVRKESRAPIIMLTARKEEVDRVLGLEMGADDYVTKPFSIRELLARIKTILRRSTEQRAEVSVFNVGSLEIDFQRYVTKVRGKPVELTAKEYQFLKCLVQAVGRALTRDELLEQVWGYDRSLEIDTHTVDQHVLRLRGKLGPEASRIVTVKGVGYRLQHD